MLYAMTDRYAQHTRRRAVIRLYPHQVAEMLNLPRDMTVESITAKPDPFHISVLVSGKNLPLCPPDAYPETIRSWKPGESRGARRIAYERERQIEVEGFTPEHDAEHSDGELQKAANCYLVAARLADWAPKRVSELRDRSISRGEDPDNDLLFRRASQNYPRAYYGWDRAPDGWPWEPASWKPSPDPISNLEKAGALIAAEIDRLLERDT